MTLADAERGARCAVESVSGPAKARLESLGFVKGSVAEVVDSGWHGVVVSVKGSRAALSPEAAAHVEVRLLRRTFSPDGRIIEA